MGFVQAAFEQGRTAHELETGLWDRMPKPGRSIFGAWSALFGDGDAGERLELEDGREVRRLDKQHRISYAFLIFGLASSVAGGTQAWAVGRLAFRSVSRWRS